jgi:tetratricopeptide (TPR) repeat protein
VNQAEARWQKLEEIFHQALNLPSGKRTAYLAESCQSDEQLRQEVEELLSSCTTGRRIEEAVMVTAQGLMQEFQPGDRFGPYRIEAPLGRGGMATVHRATREGADFEQTVAIKFLLGYLNSEQAEDRFRRERQILARLSHPNIARLLDGGTWQGRPYLVMEFVEGVPLDQYCRDRNLSLDEQLHLVSQVCGAVAYAHAQLVVHRDLKPQNILVTGDGIPKLLDFGIAKSMIEEEDGLTRASERLLTPHYAAPEQILAQPITTGTDVYALGVILYELVAGAAPFDRPGLTGFALERAICEQEPPRLPPEARADDDLNYVIARAMRKEPASRYPSVTALRDDIERLRQGYPVTARQGTWQYRASKFIRRRAGALVASLLVVAALVGGAISTRIQQRRAEQRFQEVRSLANNFLFEFHDTISPLPGATRARQMVVSRAVEYLDRLARESQGDLSLQQDLAAGYERIRDIQFGTRYGHLNDVAGARVSGEKALQLRRRFASDRNPSPGAAENLARALTALGEIESAAGSSRIGLELLEEAKALIARLPPGDGRDRLEAQAAIAESNLGQNEGDAERATAAGRRGVELMTAVARRDPSPETQMQLGTALLQLGGSLTLAANRPDEALPYFHQAEPILRRIADSSANNIDAMRNLHVSLTWIGLAHAVAYRHQQALPFRREALALARNVYNRDPDNSLAARDLVDAYINAAQNEYKVGSKEMAISHARSVAALSEGLLAKSPESVQARDDYAAAIEDLADYLVRTHPKDEPFALLTKALSIREEDARRYPERALLQSRLGHLYVQWGDSYLLNWKDPKEAGRFYQKAISIYERLQSEGRLNGLDQRDWNLARDRLAKTNAN